jgi:hypothetical protein
MKIMKPTMHHVREDEKHETKRKNNTKAACDGIKIIQNAGEKQETNPQLQLLFKQCNAENIS